MARTPKIQNQPLVKRILSAVVLIAVVGLALFLGEMSFLTLIALICVICIVEILYLGPKTKFIGTKLAAIVVILGGAYFVGLMRLHEMGLWIVVVLLLIVWATDIGALTLGKLFRGPKLNPTISPNKTWAGLIGGILCSAIVGLVISTIIQATVGHWVLFAAFIAICAQAGDLLESMFKRRLSVKDSSDLIPGHGGMLDRVDGLIAAGLGLGIFDASLTNWTNYLFP